MADDTMSWFAAVDWGSAQHQACLLDRGAVVGERAFRAEAMAQWHAAAAA
jgi:hypothetical protein